MICFNMSLSDYEEFPCGFWGILTLILAKIILCYATVGRKNWLFSDTPKGAEASATVYTMVEMAKAHDLNIHAYLEYLLERRPSADMTDEQLEKLAPWNDDVRKACGNNGRKENLEM